MFFEKTGLNMHIQKPLKSNFSSIFIVQKYEKKCILLLTISPGPAPLVQGAEVRESEIDAAVFLYYEQDNGKKEMTPFIRSTLLILGRSEFLHMS